MATSYASNTTGPGYGEINGGTSYPEPTPAQKRAAEKADEIGHAELLRLGGMDTDMLNRLIKVGLLPKSEGQKPGRFGGFDESLYKRSAIVAKLDQLSLVAGIAQRLSAAFRR